MSTAHARHRRASRIAHVLAVPIAILLSGAMIGTASYAAFSATTSSPTSNWAAGTVALSDDDSATALFTATSAVCVTGLAVVDTPGHWSPLGEWIIRERAVPFTEPFAWTRAGDPYYAYSWLAQVTFYATLREWCAALARCCR